jgi:hypothetical protein
MQPNPADTTNLLMLQLIKIVAEGPDAVNDINGLPSSTDYPSSTVWIQTLAYASLSFSVLAAFGAVMGKQWLNSFKASRGRGSLEERGLQRQKRLDGLEYWHLQTVLRAFLVLLQISLLLFGLSLSANMWTQQRTISSVIITATALGILFYVGTIVISVLHPDSPFQTAGSALVGALSRKVFEAIPNALHNGPSESTSTPNIFRKSSPIRWIIETSTNPEVVEAAAAMVPLVQWSPTIDASTAYGCLVDNLATCIGSPELVVTYVKAMVHLRVQSPVNGFPVLMKEWESSSWGSWGDKSRFTRDAFMDARRAWHQFKNAGRKDDQLMLLANARTALRTAVVHGEEILIPRPDDEHLIWYGDLRWNHANGHTPSYEEFDWLIDYLVDQVHDETVGDALLVLSGMHGLGSSTKRSSYVEALIHCMAPTRPSRVRHAALRAVSDAGKDLASVADDSMSRGLGATLLDRLSRALSLVIRPNNVRNRIPPSHYVNERNCCYLRLISALTKNDEWCKRLTRDDHVEWCLSRSRYDTVLASSFVLDKVFLAGILRIDPSGAHISFNPVQEKRWMLVNSAWEKTFCFYGKDVIGALPVLVAETRQNLPDFTGTKLADLASAVHKALRYLQSQRGWRDHAIVLLINAVLPIVQGLYDELSPYAEHPSASQHNSGS